MAGGHDQADFVAIKRHDLQALLVGRQLRHAEIGGVIHHRVDHARTVGAIQLQLHRREKLLVHRENFRQQVNARGFVGRDHQFAARIGFQLGDGVLRALAQLQNLLGVIGEDAAGGGQRDAAAEALEQFGAQFLFQLADLRADGRLRPVTGLRSLGEALQPNDLEKRMELIEIHKSRAVHPVRRASQKLNRRDRNNVFPPHHPRMVSIVAKAPGWCG